MAEGDLDPLQESCLPDSEANRLQESDEICQHVPGSSTNTSTANNNVNNSRYVNVTSNVSARRDVKIKNIIEVSDARVQNLQKRTSFSIEERTRGMVVTAALNEVMDKLTSGVTWITIKGQPGEGKSTAAFMALGRLQQSGREVFKVNTPEEFSGVTATCPRPVIMLDDIFGNLDFDQGAWSRWQSVLNDILEEKEHTLHDKILKDERGDNFHENKLKEKEVTVILVSRNYVLNNVSNDIGKVGRYFTDDEYVVFMSNRGERKTSEKVAILNAICESKDCQLDEETIHIICNTDGPHGFPHTCRLFVTLRKEGVEIDTERFMKSPLTFLNQTVQKFFEDDTKLLLFKEMLKRDGKISVSDLQSLDKSVRNLADSLLDSYLRKEYDCYFFHHPSIYDSVSFILLKHDPLFVIEHCSVSFLHERLRLDPSRDTQHATPSSESNLVVYIPRENLTVLAKRFATEILRRNLVHVLSHPAVRDEQFVIKMMSYIWLPGYRLPRLTDRNTGVSFLSLIASSKSHQILKYIDNHRLRKLSNSQLTTVLYGVCKYDALDVLKYLENHRFGQLSESQLKNVLYEVCKYDALDVLKYLENQRLGQLSKSQLDTVLNTVCRYDASNILKYLEKHILGQLSKSQLTTVLYEVCGYGAVDVLTYLVQSHVVDVNDKVYGASPLWWACRYNHMDVARVLIDRGARVDAETVVYACSRGNLDLVKLLWERGATVNMTAYSDTLLTAASVGGHVKVMSFLIDKGSSVNTADRCYGQSPLHWACRYNKPQAVQCLLDQGADIYSRDDYNRTPLDRAVMNRSQQCIDLLQNVIADREIKNNREETVNTK